MKISIRFSLLALLILTLTACGQLEIGLEDPSVLQPEEQSAGLANPASVFCRESGYDLEIRTEEDGGQYGVCIFPDGSECEEWAFYRGECSPASSAENDVIQVAGWLGSVRTVTEDNAIDDALVFFPEEIGEVGLTGADAAIEAQIVDLRDVEPPGKYAHFWGSLTCSGEDMNGCQLIVDRIRVGATATSGDRVEGWEGTIISGEFNGGLSYVFVLSGSYPMPFSIHSTDSAVLADIEALLDSGDTIRVWGELLTGIPDVNGARIQAEQIELLP